MKTYATVAQLSYINKVFMSEKLPDDDECEERGRTMFPRKGGLKAEPSVRGERYVAFFAFDDDRDPGMIEVEVDRDVFCVMSGKHDEIRSIGRMDAFERTGLYMELIALKVFKVLEGKEEEDDNFMMKRRSLTLEGFENPRGEYFSFSMEILEGIKWAIAKRIRAQHKN